MTLDLVAALVTGIALSACAGLRAFLPLFAVGVASRMSGWELGQAQWLSTDSALIIFGVASAIELIADKIPFLDHALDVVQTISRPVAGAVVTLGPFYELSPTYAVPLAIVTGSSIAMGVHTAKATTRAQSSALTVGMGNPILSFIEDIFAIGGTVLAFVAPLIVIMALVGLVYLVFRVRARRRRAPAVEYESKPA
jgi:hypothetical protein